MKRKGPDEPTSSTDLGLLLATELELEAMLAHAHEEARQLVQAAGAEVGAASIELDRQLSAARADFEAEVEAERARRAAEVLAEARRRVAEVDAVPEERILELGRIALAGLLRGMAG
jgi:vacuolar-type H+-ATPase subunit H